LKIKFFVKCASAGFSDNIFFSTSTERRNTFLEFHVFSSSRACFKEKLWKHPRLTFRSTGILNCFTSIIKGERNDETFHEMSWFYLALGPSDTHTGQGGKLPVCKPSRVRVSLLQHHAVQRG
jgi:hypothetical protein